LADSRWFIADS